MSDEVRSWVATRIGAWRATERRALEDRLRREAEDLAERTYSVRMGDIERRYEQRIRGLDQQLALAERSHAQALADVKAELASLEERRATQERIAEALQAADDAPDPGSFVAEVRRAFPGDGVETLRRARTAIEVVHTVRIGKGRPIAVVLYHLSEEPGWRPALVRHAARAAARCDARVTVLVSRSLPNGVRHATFRDGVIVARPAIALPLARALRRAAVAAHGQAVAQVREAEQARRRAARAASLEAFRASARSAFARFSRAVVWPVTVPVRALARTRRGAAVPMAEAPRAQAPEVASAGAPAAEAAASDVRAAARVAEIEALILRSTDPRERSVLLEERARERIHARDPSASGAVLEAVEHLRAERLSLAACDLLLSWIAEGPPDRDAQVALLRVERDMGLTSVAADRGRLLAELLRLDGRDDRAREVSRLAE